MDRLFGPGGCVCDVWPERCEWHEPEVTSPEASPVDPSLPVLPRLPEESHEGVACLAAVPVPLRP